MHPTFFRFRTQLPEPPRAIPKSVTAVLVSVITASALLTIASPAGSAVSPTRSVSTGLVARGNAANQATSSSTPPPGPRCSVFRSPASPTGGYWLAGADGSVYPCEDAPFYGSLSTLHIVPNQSIVGIAATPDDQGYWLVADGGGLFAFGDAGYFGSMGGKVLNAPIVGIAATPQGGYYEVASDGGIFGFGSGATFYGSMGGRPLNKPIVGMATTPAGGYYEVASDGGVFSFGPGTPFLGSMGGEALNKPVVGIAANPTGGYYEVASDGGIFNFGAPFHGSTGCLTLNEPIVGIAVSSNTTSTGTGTACGVTYTQAQAPGGYQFVASDGGVFSFGNSVFKGSLAGEGVTDIVGIAEAS